MRDTRLARVLFAVIVGVFALVVLMATCVRPAEAALPDPEVIGSSERFTAIGGGSGGGTCWAWEGTWRGVNPSGVTSYRFGMRLSWCSNAAGTKVTSLKWSNVCKHYYGFYTFDGCSKQRSAFGLNSVNVNDVWRYHFDGGIYTIHKTPSVDATVFPDGRVVGTVYYS